MKGGFKMMEISKWGGCGCPRPCSPCKPPQCAPVNIPGHSYRTQYPVLVPNKPGDTVTYMPGGYPQAGYPGAGYGYPGFGPGPF